MPRDIFAEIASERSNAKKDALIVPEPRVLPPRNLPLSDDPSSVEIVKERKIDTADKLAEELAIRREWASGFLRRLSPDIQATRTVGPVTSFDWRVETENDRLNFTGTLEGEGEWKRVSIPHYGEPSGKAVTYYRGHFSLEPAPGGLKRCFVCFDGVDYQAHVFVNGSFVGSHEGFFAPFEFDISDRIFDGENTLLVKVENDYIHLGNDDPPDIDGKPGEFSEGEKIYAATGLGYDDPNHGWHHCPPGMGICQGVHIGDLFVRPLSGLQNAEVWVELNSCSPGERSVTLEYDIYGRNFQETVCEGERYIPAIREIQGDGDVPIQDSEQDTPLLMGPGTNFLRFSVSIPDARVWSPETPWLYQIHVRVLADDGRILDATETQFGMRWFILDEASSPKGKPFLNGREIRLRGSNTMGNFQQDVFASDWDQLIDDILLAKICNMSFLRLTQRPVQKEIYDFCDRLGLMTQTDLPLFGVLRRNKFSEAARQAGEMERLVRSHPCNIMVTYIDEAFPNGRNKPHRHLLRHELDRWIRSANQEVWLQNPDRVIKPHDGDYDPPGPGLPDHHCYTGWYNGHGLGIGKLHRGYWQQVKEGWHYACGEFGSEGLDPVPIMHKHYPESWLLRPSDKEAAWNPSSIIKSQTGRYHFMWFDTQHSLADWVKMSHRHQAQATRIMTEAFRRDPRMVSFAIHLFIDAFPSGWMKAIMDVVRGPKEAYFIYHDALSPIMGNLRTDRFSYRSREQVSIEAWVCNDLDSEREDLHLRYRVLDHDSIVAAGESPADVPRCTSRFQGMIQFAGPLTQKRTELQIELALTDGNEATVHSTELLLSLFPKDLTGDREQHESRPATVFGKGPARALAIELGLREVDIQAGPGLILIDDYASFIRCESAVIAAVKEGATAVFLELGRDGELSDGAVTIEGQPIGITKTGMGEFYFVSRQTDHELVRDFEPDDFKFWYDPKSDCIKPIISSVFVADGWDAILASGIVSWETEGGPALAAAEKPIGEGMLRICQVKLAGRLINPVAEIFTQRLLS